VADTKLTALNEIGAALASTDIFYVVDDPGGTPLSRKSTISRIPTFVGTAGLTMTAPIGITMTGLTIASGVITVTRGYHTVATEGGASSDDLVTINGGVDGMTLVLRAVDAADTVVVKDGTGNIQGPGDVSLDNAQDTITLIYDAALTAWLVTAVSNNGA
jgi:hypothetical protein